MQVMAHGHGDHAAVTRSTWSHERGGFRTQRGAWTNSLSARHWSRSACATTAAAVPTPRENKLCLLVCMCNIVSPTPHMLMLQALSACMSQAAPLCCHPARSCCAPPRAWRAAAPSCWQPRRDPTAPLRRCV